MSEMIERVARAMAFADLGTDTWDVKSEEDDGCGYLGKEDFRVMARAAIEAMREPTMAMIDAGDAEDVHCLAQASVHYTAMIDAALKE